MANNHTLTVLAHYPPVFRSAKLAYLAGAGGFSGAEFWRFSTAMGDFCLRRWPPEHPSEDRLRLIHAVLRHAARAGITFVPLPVATVHGDSFVRHGGRRFWELTPWLPGTADFHVNSEPKKLEAALTALAQFHSAAEDFPHPSAGKATSPTIASRLELVQELLAGEAEQIAGAVSHAPPSHPLMSYAQPILRGFFDFAPQTQQELLATSTLQTQLQPIIRDIHSDHVLFDGERVTGIIDFGAMNIDTPAADVARLLGSLVEDDAAAWQAGLRAYESIRPLTDVQRQLVAVFDRSSVVLSGMNWLRWLYLENRRFNNLPAIAARLQTAVRRLGHLRFEGSHEAEGESPQ